MNIVETNNDFDFSTITLAHPIVIQGGSYFTKIEYNKKPLYVQTSESLTKQGIVKTGKKYHCDLMFDKTSETTINWFENLLEKCQKLIYEKKEEWFQGNLEESDIETAFNPIIRLYKSGKYYLLRANVKSSKEDDNPLIKIYDDTHKSLTINDVKNETKIISILEIQGIKFTTRNFQIEIELKQVMIVNNEILFEDFLINTKKPLQQAQTLAQLQETTLINKNSIISQNKNETNETRNKEQPVTILCSGSL